VAVPREYGKRRHRRGRQGERQERKQRVTKGKPGRQKETRVDTEGREISLKETNKEPEKAKNTGVRHNITSDTRDRRAIKKASVDNYTTTLVRAESTGRRDSTTVEITAGRSKRTTAAEMKKESVYTCMSRKSSGNSC